MSQSRSVASLSPMVAPCVSATVDTVEMSSLTALHQKATGKQSLHQVTSPLCFLHKHKVTRLSHSYDKVSAEVSTGLS